MTQERIEVTESVADSRRFGLRVFRCRVDGGKAEAFADALERSHADVTIVRSACGKSGWVQALGQQGYRVTHAGSLVYYRRDFVDQYRVGATIQSIEIDLAHQSESPALRNIAGRAFEGFNTHYAASPEFPTTDVLEGYKEWAASCLTDGQHTVLAAREQGVVVGFLAYKPEPQLGSAEIVLNAVLPSHSKRGIYTELLRTTMQRITSEGYRSLIVSTPLQNYPVQKVWAREGLHLYLALDTFHVFNSGVWIESR